MIHATQLLCDFHKWITPLIEFKTNHPTLFTLIIGIIGSLFAAYLYSLFNRIVRSKEVIKKWKEISNQKKEYIRSNSDYDIDNYFKENSIYIQPYLTDTPPHPSHDPAITLFKAKRELRKFFIKEVFIRETKESNKVFFLFGDSGTGKSAALIHLYVDYIKKYNEGERPFQIRLISLRENNAIKEITSIPEKDRKNLILLLDAMDETPEVYDPTQLDNFLDNIKETFHDFARIVITCRPQFFPDNVRQEIITNPKGIRTSTGFLKCSIKYLTPFNNKQIRQYLNRTYPAPFSIKKRLKAMRIVKKQPLIAIRPLVLSYIHDIVKDGKPINTTLDLYDTIIESILNRDIYKALGLENDKEKIKKWWEASSLVAKYMYENQKLNITDSELDSILPIDIEKQFKQRSLLTRYGNEFLFSHKSFYEYFIAYRFLQHPEEIKQVYGMDLQFYNDILQTIFEQKETPFVNLKDTHPYTVAHSLNNIGSALEDINHFTQAKSYYEAALGLFRQLEERKPNTYNDDIAMVLNNLAGIYWKTNHLDNAIRILTDDLTTYRQLAAQKPDDYLPYVAGTLNNLGLLHRNTNRHQEAEEEYNEALTIRRQLAEKNPDAYLPNVADTV